MGLQTKELRVGALRIQTTQFPAVQAFRLWARILPLITPGLGRLPALRSLKLADLGEFDVGAFLPALGTIVAQLTPDLAESLMYELLSETEVTYPRGGKLAALKLNSQAAIDEVFGGDVGALLRTMKHALEVNFAGFGIGASTGLGGIPDAPVATAPVTA
jgi:hypothetical protein